MHVLQTLSLLKKSSVTFSSDMALRLVGVSIHGRSVSIR